MNIEFGTSNRRRPTLIYQGYEYVKKQETNTTTHWICRHYRQIKCSSLVITSGSEIIKMPKDHICNFKPGATEARQAKNKMKEKALTTTNYVAIASTLQEIQNDLQAMSGHVLPIVHNPCYNWRLQPTLYIRSLSEQN